MIIQSQIKPSGDEFRRRYAGELAEHVGPMTAATFERELDYLLLAMANLAREPLMVHLRKLAEVSLIYPLPLRQYPDPKEGAKS